MKHEKLSLHLDTQHKDAIGDRTEFFLQKLNETVVSSSVDERAGKPAQITGAPRSGRGPGVRLCCIRFVFIGSLITCTFYKSTLSAQAKVSLQLTASLSGLI